MANHVSALKRARQNDKRRARNAHFKSFMRSRVRRVRDAVKAGKATEAELLLRSAMSALHRVAGKGIIHTRTADRKIGRLGKLVATLSA